MAIKCAFRMGSNDCKAENHVMLCAALYFACGGYVYFVGKMSDSRDSIFPPHTSNATSILVRYQCEIPYDQCRCSLMPNGTNQSVECVTDLDVLVADALPLVSYALLLCVIYKFFSFEGHHKPLLVDVARFTALAVFVIIALITRDRGCFHFGTVFILAVPSQCLFMFWIHWFTKQDDERLDECSCRCRGDCRAQKMATMKNGAGSKSIVTV